MKIYLEYKDEKSHKFWKIEQNGNNHTVGYGKIGSTGVETTKEFASEEKALNDAEKKIAAKKKKGYIVAIEAESVRIPLKRLTFKKSAKYNFDFNINSINNPKGKHITIEEAHKKYRIVGGQLENYVTSAFVLEGDVHIKNREEFDTIDKEAYKKGHTVLILIDGNLTIESDLSLVFSPLLVQGDLKCKVLDTDDLDVTIKGDVYAKYAFVHYGNDGIFDCYGSIFTPYFLSNDDRVWVSPHKESISINFGGDVDKHINYNYKPKELTAAMNYKVFDYGYDFSVSQFIECVRTGENPIREFQLSKKEIREEKKRKLSDLMVNQIKEVQKAGSKILDLSKKNLKSIPLEVFELKDLEVLNLESNKIKTISNEIKEMSSLKILNASNNNAINLEGVCTLESLEKLDVSGCAHQWDSSKVFKFPKEIGKLKKLKKLNADVGGAGIKNPNLIAALENLEDLVISYYYLPIPIKKLKTLLVKGICDKKCKIKIQEIYPNVEIKFSTH